MANPMAYHAHAQNKGTLFPGQQISVNKFNVQVERYLSQGGFAHVYLVRTATPVYNTTHHVLKRIAVANEAMLSEVKKEVDVMRLLKGHPNIVHFIDAAWNKLPNGTYEVFILMEYCPGGGIIDMMNRRLRERLTEAEILQIFVDICEGVAYMHSLRPPLLHRDLKVENILQSSPTSYKLCDFGSAAAVSRPPSTAQEIRALEADLAKHTTLQYRAPEMVDLYSKRPVDEKSDVWALGVLLYKLCYYTTPFEEHGPLAIINVQYHIPPYPVYSPQMHQLIASMLQEHGVQRPSIFDILTHVHRLRGTKSLYHYNVSPPPLPPRPPTQIKPSPSPNITENKIQHAASQPKNMDVQKADMPRKSLSSSKTPGTEPLLSSIPLVRRGRPVNFKGSTTTTSNTMNGQSPSLNAVSSDLWKISGQSADSRIGQDAHGFGDNFVDLDIPPSSTSLKGTTPTLPKPATSVTKPFANSNPTKPRDAFEGLGLALQVEKSAPTLAEARKLRTGLAIMTSTHNEKDKPSSNSKSSPFQYPQSQQFSQSRPSSSQSKIGTFSQLPSRSNPTASFSAETRFPSLEELNASFSSGSGNWLSNPSDLQVTVKLSPERQKHNQLPLGSSEKPLSFAPRMSHHAKTAILNEPSLSLESNKGESQRTHDHPGGSNFQFLDSDSPHRSPHHGVTRRISLTKRHSLLNVTDSLVDTSVPSPQPSFRTLDRPRSSRAHQDTQTDVLSNTLSPAITPVLRESPSKRASLILQSSIPSQATIVTEPSPQPEKKRTPSPQLSPSPVISPTLLKFNSAHPVLDSLGSPPVGNAPSNAKVASEIEKPLEVNSNDLRDLDSSSDEGPEDADRFVPSSKRPASSKDRRGRQSSVHDLVDLWGGGIGIKEKERDSHKAQPVPRPPVQSQSTTRPNPSGDFNLLGAPPSRVQRSPGRQMLSIPQGTAEGLHPKDKATLSSSTSSRSRPQSLIIFPSKSADGSTTPIAGLHPPQEAKRTSVRRTSISDMVQRYEELGAQARPLLPSASPTSKFAGKTAAVLSELVQQPTNDHRNSRPPDSLAVTSSLGDGSRTSPLSSLSTQADNAVRNSGRTISRSPVSLKSEAAKSVFPSSPQRATEEHSHSGDVRSPSPERPYEGVGKLIDQWQRKTAEAAASANLSRALPPKRAGLQVGSRGR